MNLNEWIALREEFGTLLISVDKNMPRLLEIIKIIGVDEDDDEIAHSMEKQLWEAVLQIRANEGDNLAKVALSTSNIKFHRWFA
jgi:hypothetical protein